MLKMDARREEDRRRFSTMDYDESVRKEVELVKGELGKLKLGMASMVEEKAKAVSTLQQAHSKIQSDSATAEELKTQLQIASEEHVLVELARIEAIQEVAQIQALRQKGFAEFASAREEIETKIKQLSREIDESKNLEHQLALTLADINQLKEMKAEESRTSQSLLSITQELEAAKEQLGSIRYESFLFMSSMDTIRKELERVTSEIGRLKRSADSKAKNLKSKLLRAKSKYEAAESAEQKTQSILLNLSLTLQQLHTEAEASKKEKALITEETRSLKAETQNTESQMSIYEEQLQVATRDLEDVKSSEASALNKLKSLIENTLPTRASSSSPAQQNSTISISKFEYEYLTGRAAKAEEIADKKVAAAQAWIEALEASEKEVTIKVEIAQRDLQEMKMEEERKVGESERSIPVKRKSESSSQKLEKTAIDETQKKSLKYGGKLSTPSSSAQAAKLSNSDSPATRRSTTPVIIKKKKVITKLAKFFGKKKD